MSVVVKTLPPVHHEPLEEKLKTLIKKIISAKTTAEHKEIYSYELYKLILSIPNFKENDPNMYNKIYIKFMPLVIKFSKAMDNKTKFTQQFEEFKSRNPVYFKTETRETETNIDFLREIAAFFSFTSLLKQYIDGPIQAPPVRSIPMAQPPLRSIPMAQPVAEPSIPMRMPTIESVPMINPSESDISDNPFGWVKRPMPIPPMSMPTLVGQDMMRPVAPFNEEMKQPFIDLQPMNTAFAMQMQKPMQPVSMQSVQVPTVSMPPVQVTDLPMRPVLPRDVQQNPFGGPAKRMQIIDVKPLALEIVGDAMNDAKDFTRNLNPEITAQIQPEIDKVIDTQLKKIFFNPNRHDISNLMIAYDMIAQTKQLLANLKLKVLDLQNPVKPPTAKAASSTVTGAPVKITAPPVTEEPVTVEPVTVEPVVIPEIINIIDDIEQQINIDEQCLVSDEPGLSKRAFLKYTIIAASLAILVTSGALLGIAAVKAGLIATASKAAVPIITLHPLFGGDIL
jgi:hypothetical protein